MYSTNWSLPELESGQMPNLGNISVPFVTQMAIGRAIIKGFFGHRTSHDLGDKKSLKLKGVPLEPSSSIPLPFVSLPCPPLPTLHPLGYVERVGLKGVPFEEFFLVFGIFLQNATK